MKNSILILFFALFVSCSLDDTQPEPEVVDFTALNEQEILDYIDDNNLVAQKSASGLYYVINELGEGVQPTLASNVTVAYKGYLTNGDVFDEQDEATFDLPDLIAGFAEGATYFKEGGNGVLLLPSRLAYSNRGSGSIPPGAVIIFDIDLVSVN